MALRKHFLASGIAGALMLAAFCTEALAQSNNQAEAPDATEKLDLKTQRLAWNNDNNKTSDAGTFEWMGSIIVGADRKRFGGWSGLAVSRDGASLLAVSDEGKWFSAKILYDEKERLAGIGDGRIGSLPALDGKPIAREFGYASGLLADSINLQSGYVYVSFERAHRVWRYQLTPAGIKGKPEVIITARRLGKLANGGGIEGLAMLNSAGPVRDTRNPDKPLFAVTENSRDPRGNLRAFIIEGRTRKRLSISLNDPYRPTDIARLPDGDFLLLERHFSLLTGKAGIQLRRIARRDIKPGATITGEVLFDAQGRERLDNMEGMALRRGRDGETWIYMISDNNFNELQRTQLTMFRLKKTPVPVVQGELH